MANLAVMLGALVLVAVVVLVLAVDMLAIVGTLMMVM